MTSWTGCIDRDFEPLLLLPPSHQLFFSLAFLLIWRLWMTVPFDCSPQEYLPTTMSSIGPQLPPHLAKRKRNSEDEADSASVSPPSKTPRGPNAESDSDDDDHGPSAPKSSIGPTMPPPTEQEPVIGPVLPRSVAAGPTLPPTNTDEIALNSEGDDAFDPVPTTGSPVPPTKRVLGPAPPPAPLSTRPATSPNSDSDSDDEYGPALPSASLHGPSRPESYRAQQQVQQPEALKRDNWMLAPPPASTGYQERDPTKLKARKFASGSSATTRPKDGSSGVSSIWTETPEEKARRLADAVLGRGGDAAAADSSKPVKRQEKQQPENDSHIRAFTEQTRGRSLYEAHQAARKAGKATNAGGARKRGGEQDEEDDDPSKRAFDREKDMALGGRITASQRKELLNRASDFGGRFSKGNYL